MTPVVKNRLLVSVVALVMALSAAGCAVHAYAGRPGYTYRTTAAVGYTYQYTPEYGYVYVRPAPIVVRSSPPPRTRVVVRSRPSDRHYQGYRTERGHDRGRGNGRGNGRGGGRGHGRH
jgi:hypothetical protein